MKKKNSLSKYVIILAVMITLLLFGYIYVMQGVKTLSTQKVRKEEELIGKRDQLEVRLVEAQQLSSEERIVKIVSDSLGLERSLKPYEVLNVSRSQIKQIEEIIEKKYE